MGQSRTGFTAWQALSRDVLKALDFSCCQYCSSFMNMTGRTTSMAHCSGNRLPQVISTPGQGRNGLAINHPAELFLLTLRLRMARSALQTPLSSPDLGNLRVKYPARAVQPTSMTSLADVATIHDVPRSALRIAVKPL